MGADRFIASKLRFKGKAALAATAVSSFVIVVALSIAGGFRCELRNAISDLSADVLLTDALGADCFTAENPVKIDSSLIAQILEVEGVQDVTPALYRAGIVKNGDLIEGVLFKSAEGYSSLEVGIPPALARKLGYKKGDRMLTYFVGTDKTKARNFSIKRILDSSVELDKTPIVRCNPADLQRLALWQEDEASALEVRIGGKYPLKSGKLDEKADEIGAVVLDGGLCSSSASKRYRALFDWIQLIDVNVAAILILMSIVAGFNMISALLILLMRSVPAIGMMKALGMRNKDIRKVYLRICARQVGLGLAIGNAASLVLCLIQHWTHILKLDPENYFVSFVPTDFNIPLILGADALAWVVVMALLFLGTRYISGIDPAQSTKAQ